MVIDELEKYDRFVIYGAQVIAYGAYVAIKHLTGRKPTCFVVGNMNGNPEEIDGISVKLIDVVDQNTFILVGVTELFQREVLTYLKIQGYQNIFTLTHHEEHLLMSKYYNSVGKFPVVQKTSENSEIDLKVFEVRNHNDKHLTTRPVMQPFEYTIQAGAALTKDRISVYADNIGKNISVKNKQYCEMTATYWIWKNIRCDWVGIEHYRRHLLLKPEYISDDVDVILPLPYICYPNEMAQFQRFVSDKVCSALLQGLKEVHPNEYEQFEKILYGQYQYTYNLVCAKKSVFDAYCRWFFEITEHIETFEQKVPEIKETRALSYIAEVLTNLYFMINSDKLKIRHVEKAIYY